MFEILRGKSRDTGGIGLVLAGGGAKGAYEAGVWKAMSERGLSNRVRVLSGTSVGAINAAAFAAIGDPGRIEAFWKERIGATVSSRTEGLFSKQAVLSWLTETADRVAHGRGFPFAGALDRTGLELALRDLLPEAWPQGAPAVYATALECVDGPWPAGRLQKHVFRVDAEPDPERRRRMILASAAIPFGLNPVEIGGTSFVDGGWDAMGGENVPATPILENHPDIRTIIVVHLTAASLAEKQWHKPTRRPALLGGIRYIEIQPSEPLPGPFDEAAKAMEGFVTEDLARKAAPVARLLRNAGGVLAFNRDYATKSFALGYADALRTLTQV